MQGALSYVTGSHNVKVGMSHQWGKYPRYNNANADLICIFRSFSGLICNDVSVALDFTPNTGGS